MNGWLDIIRREAGVVAGQRQGQCTLVVTSYNPDKHAVKGTLQPHGVETGWVPVASMAVGNGYGIAVGPSIGDQFSVEFENGDPNSPVAKSRLFSASSKPPRAESGEVAIKSQFGHVITLTKDGKLTVTSPGDTTISVTGTLNISAATVNIN